MDEILLNIVNKCIELEKVAYSTYSSISNNIKDEKLSLFFKEMANEELGHIQFWEHTQMLVKSSVVEHIMDREEEMLKEISDTYKIAFNLKERIKSQDNLKNIFTLSLYLETYLMRPSFVIVFEFVKNISNIKNPLDSYKLHLERFINKFKEQNIDNLELTSIAGIIFQLYKENLELSRLNQVDILSGLLNRRGLFSTLHSIVHILSRDKKPCGMIMIDIDNFKRINDEYGHQLGDQVISAVGSIIKSCIRKSDIAGRYGGEEFLVLLPDIKSGNIKNVAENIRLKISEEFKNRIPITISAGCSYLEKIDRADEDLMNLIRIADGNMYVSKREGKNRVTC